MNEHPLINLRAAIVAAAKIIAGRFVWQQLEALFEEAGVAAAEAEYYRGEGDTVNTLRNNLVESLEMIARVARKNPTRAGLDLSDAILGYAGIVRNGDRYRRSTRTNEDRYQARCALLAQARASVDRAVAEHRASAA